MLSERPITNGLDRFVADPCAGDIRRLNTIEWLRPDNLTWPLATA